MRKGGKFDNCSVQMFQVLLFVDGRDKIIVVNRVTVHIRGGEWGGRKHI